MHWLKSNYFSCKALILLSVYLLHFCLFQSFVACFSGGNQFNTKSFFTVSHKNTDSNSGIATFRILEKHKGPQKAFELAPDFSASLCRLSDVVSVTDTKLIDPTYYSSSFHFADTSYRLYARDCVFRI